MTNKTITVRNIGTESVLVGARYLLPGEERAVLQSHYEAAGGKDRLAVVGGVIPAVEVEAEIPPLTPPFLRQAQDTGGSLAVEPESAPPPSRKRSQSK